MADKRDDSYEKYLRMAESAFLEPGPSSSKSLPAAPAKKLDVKENRNKKDRKEFSLDEPLEFVGPGKPTLIKFSAREVREESESDATDKEESIKEISDVENSELSGDDEMPGSDLESLDEEKISEESVQFEQEVRKSSKNKSSVPTTSSPTPLVRRSTRKRAIVNYSGTDSRNGKDMRKYLNAASQGDYSSDELTTPKLKKYREDLKKGSKAQKKPNVKPRTHENDNFEVEIGGVKLNDIEVEFLLQNVKHNSYLDRGTTPLTTVFNVVNRGWRKILAALKSMYGKNLDKVAAHSYWKNIRGKLPTYFDENMNIKTTRDVPYDVLVYKEIFIDPMIAEKEAEKTKAMENAEIVEEDLHTKVERLEKQVNILSKVVLLKRNAFSPNINPISNESLLWEVEDLQQRMERVEEQLESSSEAEDSESGHGTGDDDE